MILNIIQLLTHLLPNAITLVRIFDNHVQLKRHHLQEIICIDDFYFDRRSKYKYAFMIMGFKN